MNFNTEYEIWYINNNHCDDVHTCVQHKLFLTYEFVMSECLYDMSTHITPYACLQVKNFKISSEKFGGSSALQPNST